MKLRKVLRAVGIAAMFAAVTAIGEAVGKEIGRKIKKALREDEDGPVLTIKIHGWEGDPAPLIEGIDEVLKKLKEERTEDEQPDDDQDAE